MARQRIAYSLFHWYYQGCWSRYSFLEGAERTRGRRSYNNTQRPCISGRGVSAMLHDTIYRNVSKLGPCVCLQGYACKLFTLYVYVTCPTHTHECSGYAYALHHPMTYELPRFICAASLPVSGIYCSVFPRKKIRCQSSGCMLLRSGSFELS